MNDITNVIKKIEADALQAVREIEADTRAETEKIAADYARQAEELKGQIEQETESKMETIRLRNQSQMDITERSLKLSYRRKAMAQAFSLALGKLASMDRKEYEVYLLKQIEKYQSQNGVLVLNAKDRAEIGPAVVAKAAAATGKELTLAEEAGSFSGGFILKEGSIEINCTFEVLVSSIKEEIEGSVAAALFS